MTTIIRSTISVTKEIEAVAFVTAKMKNDETVEIIDIIIMRIIIAATAQIIMSDAPAIVKITKMKKMKIIILGNIMTITMIIIIGDGDIIDSEDIMAVGIDDKLSFNHLPSAMYGFELYIDRISFNDTNNFFVAAMRNRMHF